MKASEEAYMLCTRIAGRPFDPLFIRDKFCAHPDFDPEKPIPVGLGRKHFTEIGLDELLLAAGRELPSLELKTQPIPGGTRVNGHTFNYDLAGRLHVLDNGGWNITEYDNIVEIDGGLVVFEVKSGRRWKRKRRGGTKEGDIRSHLLPEGYERKLAPLAHFALPEETAYVVVIPKDMYERHIVGSPPGSVVRRFQEKGGLVIPLNLTTAELDEAVPRWMEDSEIPIRED